MESEDFAAEGLEPVFLSALEHYSYCPRQCALIHLEQTFDENVYTLRGRAVHQRVHEVNTISEEGVQIEQSLALWSNRLGLIGQADLVEFHEGVPFPVEYKYGKYREREIEHAAVQLGGQAICLEEMTGITVAKGAVYCHSSHRRYEIAITPELRRRVETVTAAVRALLLAGELPPPVNDKRCLHCSLNSVCMPSAIGDGSKARSLVAGLFRLQD
ncbi:MAG TPA: CRISPR-associated protein Cas4 [Firmicutes bacterium]|nr:CRISPR-associated protein Cas4 [Bacillota bacterium]